VHEYDHLPIELVALMLTGCSGADDVTHSHSDPTYTVRIRLYDTDTPEVVRSKARSRRQEDRHIQNAVVECRGLALIATEGSVPYARLQANLQAAMTDTLKRRREVLEADEPHSAEDFDVEHIVPGEAGTSHAEQGDSFEDQF
jgi:hypothetical protein